MSVAALGAQVLARELRQHGLTSPGLSRRVLHGAARHVDTAWATAVGMDVLYPGARRRADSPTGSPPATHAG